MNRVFFRIMRGRAMAACVLALTVLAGTQVWARESCLRISLQEKSGRLVLRAEDAESRPSRSAGAISKDFRAIYNTLEKQSKMDADFDRRIESLGEELFGPLASSIADASCIVFSIQPAQIHYVLDLLPVDGKPLFLQKPVAYVFSSKTELAELSFGRSTRGLLLRDPDTDPDDGAGEASAMFPSSRLLLMEKTRPKILSQADYDFLLISGHGSVTPPWKDEDEEDSIGFNDDELTADRLARGRYTLIYLDSCQLGISRSFIDAARETGARYYLAPVTSNEAGNSSTRSIRYFFQNLRDGKSPLRALFEARRRLYDDFRGRASRARLMYYAFPFRLYGL